MDRFSKITNETKCTHADVDAAHATIRAYMKANGYVKNTTGYIKPARARWDGKHAFNTAMWLGIGTAAAIVTPWAMLVFPILGMLSEHYNSKNR